MWMERRDRLDRQSQRAYRRTSRAVAVPASAPLLSSKTLDFASIALCSFVLAVLCHSAATPPTSNSSSTSGMASPTSAPTRSPGSMQPFTLTTSRPTLLDEESQER
ncbi:hypothetical protein [Vacuolonema iberomarrocanum]|uniref:hypothetical protein n=1 Tax=Vacuolonema iberomarrocanum TaxID=3454632 RepID=UPI001A05BD9F|nr:hypothetical protein [filamentous cyanobacterium LEGE 07170]